MFFPDLNARQLRQFQTNLIFTEPCDFISQRGLPPCSVNRPSSTRFAGAVATIQSFTADRLFAGQTPEFFQVVMNLAQQADTAQRELRILAVLILPALWKAGAMPGLVALPFPQGRRPPTAPFL
ncbi:MAG: hypothetical protein JO185_18310 [Acidobacteriaceae bacterium]|nr:hypothetical protein [Acidobacteriaceae bacterium]